MKGVSRALRWRSSVFIRRWWSRLRHPSWYYSWPTPFVLWRDARVGGADAGRSDTIYLWPNGLRWWFLGFALFFVFSVIFSLGSSAPNSGSNSPSADSNAPNSGSSSPSSDSSPSTSGSNSPSADSNAPNSGSSSPSSDSSPSTSGSNSPSLWYSFGVSLAVLVWMVWLYPFLVFYAGRREMLADLWGTWPPQLDGFYSQQASDLVTESDKRCPLSVLLLTLLPVKKYRSAANDGSVQAALERVALTDYFASQPSSNPSSVDIWCDRGFLRWLLTRCGPVVAGQGAMLGLLILAFGFQEKQVILPILMWSVVWTGIAVGFLWHAVYAFERECRVSLPPEDLSRLPYLGSTVVKVSLLQTLPQLTVRLVVAVVGINLTFAIPLIGVIGSS